MKTTDNDMQQDLKEQEQSESKCSKQNRELIDDCFYVEEKRWGTWQSHYPDGAGIITSLTEDECVRATRYYLKLKQENRLNEVEVTYEGTVGGKL
jgi:hypothetical protein